MNISSVGGRVTAAFMGTYTSTKYAVESLSDAMRFELEPFGIEVVLVEPGVVRTSFTETALGHNAKYRNADSPYAPAFPHFDAAVTNSDRLAAEPVEIANVIAHAIETSSPRARYVAPFTGRVMIALATMLPTALFDWFSRNIAGLSRKQLLLPTR